MAVAEHTRRSARSRPRIRPRRWLAASAVSALVVVGVVTSVQVPGPASSASKQQAAAVIRHGTVRDVAYGPDPAQRFDLYLPTTDQKSPAPLVVYLHGGGWVGGARRDIERYAAPILRLRERGWAVASIDYRLAPAAPYPAQAEDLDRALRWFLSKGSRRYFIDPSTTIVAGHSSGAHLALLAALAPERMPVTQSSHRLGRASIPDAVIALAAPTSLADMAADDVYGTGADAVASLLGCPTDEPICDLPLVGELDPTQWLDLADPPMLLVYGSEDGIVPVDPQGTRLLDVARHALPDEAVRWYVVEGDNHDLPNLRFRPIADFADDVLSQV